MAFRYKHKSQHVHWETEHRKGAIHLDNDSKIETFFARKVKTFFPKNRKLKILDLGCGAGNDSVYFSNFGHEVHALDVSNWIIKRNTRIYANSSVHFYSGNILRFREILRQQFDIIYAKGSLHYFTDSQLRHIFNDCHKSLSSGGLLIFMGKSVRDPIYGVGEKITEEKNFFVIAGRYRKFFDKIDVNMLLNQSGFRVVNSTYRSGKLYGWHANWLEVVAKK